LTKYEREYDNTSYNIQVRNIHVSI